LVVATHTETQKDSARARVASAAWIAPAALIVFALVLRLGAFLTHRHLTFDDGCYGVSTIDMRHGLLPYRDLFSSQGPLHYPLLYVGDLVSGRPLNGPRVVPILAGIFTPIAVWATARRLGSTAVVAFVAGALVAVTGTMLWATGPVSGDGPAIAFATAGVWVAVVHRDQPAWWRAALAGVLLGAGIAVKAIVFPLAIPVAWWCYGRRRVGDVVLAGAAALLTWLATAVPWGLGRVWNQSIAFHLDKTANGSPVEQANEVIGWLVSHDVELVGVVVLGLVATFLLGRRAPTASRHGDLVLLTIWILTSVLVLIAEKLLLEGHLVILIPPLALLFALRPPPMRWLAIALVVLLPLQIAEVASIVWPHGYRGPQAQLIAALKALPHGSQVISDSQGYVWQSGHVTPRWLNDNSMSRIQEHDLTTAMVAAGAAEPSTCAVVISSTRFGVALPGLRDALAAQGYTSHVYAPQLELWVKPACA
jgi:hypothetical protein